MDLKLKSFLEWLLVKWILFPGFVEISEVSTIPALVCGEHKKHLNGQNDKTKKKPRLGLLFLAIAIFWEIK